MKKAEKARRRLSVVLVLLLGVSSMAIMAFQFQPYRPHSFEPLMMTRADMEASFAVQEARTIQNSGKIWVYDPFILLVEQYKGFHIIDNSNPNDPQRFAFVRVDGCTDIAVKDGIIYANNAIDLIGVKANASFTNLEVVSRARNVLPMVESPEPWSDWYFLNQLPDDLIIVRWDPITN